VSDRRRCSGLTLTMPSRLNDAYPPRIERHARYAMCHAHHRICCKCRYLERRARPRQSKRGTEPRS
jgi:hypothetical protein